MSEPRRVVVPDSLFHHLRREADRKYVENGMSPGLSDVVLWRDTSGEYEIVSDHVRCAACSGSGRVKR